MLSNTDTPEANIIADKSGSHSHKQNYILCILNVVNLHSLLYNTVSVSHTLWN